MSKGGGTQTSTTSVDPDIKRAYLENYDTAKSVAASLPQQQFAPMNAMYQSGEQALTNAALAGQGLTSVDQAAMLTQQASGPRNLSLGQGPGTLGSYMNPYSQGVTQNALADLEASRQNALRQTSQQAQAARAFGGSRQGVAEAQTNLGFTKQYGDLSARLNEQAFNQAMAAQGQDISRQLMGAGQLSGIGGQQQALRLGGAQQVMGAGGARQQLEQQQLDAMRNLATQRLGIQQTALGMQPGNLGQTTSTPLYQNRAAGGLGGALAGSQLANLVSPGNAGYGAALGGLLGYFGG
jgi:hypothetical protein